MCGCLHRVLSNLFLCVVHEWLYIVCLTSFTYYVFVPAYIDTVCGFIVQVSAFVCCYASLSLQYLNVCVRINAGRSLQLYLAAL